MSLPCCGDGRFVLVCWCHWWLIWWRVNLFWLISCYWGVWDMVFCLRLTGHWFGGLSCPIPNVFAERILHLWQLKNGSALLALMHLFISTISFLFIPEHCGWTHCPHLLQLIQSILFCFRLLVFLIIADPVFGWFLLHMWHTQLQSSELHVLHCPVNIIRVNQQSVDKWREINNWYAN